MDGWLTDDWLNGHQKDRRENNNWSQLLTVRRGARRKK
jgi:hypothetical protein